MVARLARTPRFQPTDGRSFLRHRLNEGFALLVARVARQPSTLEVATELVYELGSPSTAVYLAEPDGRSLRLLAESPRTGRAYPVSLNMASNAPASVAARARTIQLYSPDPDSHELWGSEAEPRGRLGTFAFPLVAGDRLVGAVSGDLEESLGAAEMEALASLSAILGVIFDRMALLEGARARDHGRTGSPPEYPRSSL